MGRNSSRPLYQKLTASSEVRGDGPAITQQGLNNPYSHSCGVTSRDEGQEACDILKMAPTRSPIILTDKAFNAMAPASSRGNLSWSDDGQCLFITKRGVQIMVRLSSYFRL